jgi:hypothetical protein
MRWAALTVLAIGLSACASEVQRLNLRDPRLPEEARRWLADAEDEVAITRARADDSETELAELEAYRSSLTDRLEENWPDRKSGARVEGANALRAFMKYADQRVKLAELELATSKKELSLASARLTQARAETAVRYDLAVYEIGPIINEVELLRGEIAAMERQVEDQRVSVEKAAGEAWKAFSQFVGKGGVTNALWSVP